MKPQMSVTHQNDILTHVGLRISYQLIATRVHAELFVQEVIILST
jgi:hypothetical protein